MDSHPVCNECGGGGCVKCHSGWECTGKTCNKCAMGWQLGKEKNFEKSIRELNYDK